MLATWTTPNIVCLTLLEKVIADLSVVAVERSINQTLLKGTLRANGEQRANELRRIERIASHLPFIVATAASESEGSEPGILSRQSGRRIGN